MQSGNTRKLNTCFVLPFTDSAPFGEGLKLSLFALKSETLKKTLPTSVQYLQFRTAKVRVYLDAVRQSTYSYFRKSVTLRRH